MDLRQSAKLIISEIIPQAAGIIGALVTAPAISGWYRQLSKPSFNPPSWLFGPAWTILYLLMGVALFLVWRRGSQEQTAKTALMLFGLQLALNVVWSFIFFGLKSPGLAFAEILILWCAILATTVYFFRISRPAGILLAPYLLWVTFAGILNGAIWQLNK